MTEQLFKAHQRIIRERYVEEEPQTKISSLRGYSVETVDKSIAEPLILRYEWLGTLGSATIFIGLFSPERELHGVVCFGYGPNDGGYSVRKLIGSPAFCLERGACVHYASANAASFLIRAACKMVRRIHKVSRFFAYADPYAGEYGAVYQAAGWDYLGQGLNNGKCRPERYYVLAPGLDRDNPANWRTTRVLRPRKGKSIGWEEARDLGYEIALRPAKHLYALCLDRKLRRYWHETLKFLPYPSPRPHLKLKMLVQLEGVASDERESPEPVASQTPVDQVLFRLRVARRALARAKTLQEAKHISDIAEAIRTYTERSGMAKEAQDDAASFAIEAEHRISQLYKAIKDEGMLATGTRGQLKGKTSLGNARVEPPGGVGDPPPGKRVTLPEMDISKDLAKRLRKLAPLSQEELNRRTA